MRTRVLSLLLASSLVACGGAIAQDTSDAGPGADSGSDAPPGSGVPSSPPGIDAGLPPNAGGPPPTGSATTVLAMSTLYYGDTDRSGAPAAEAWRQYGLNLDGKITTQSSTDVCTLAAGASRVSQVDGNSGIDNSFGENILPILLTVYGSDFSAATNAQLHKGDATELVRLDGLGSGPDYAPLPGLVYRAAPTSAAPAWNGHDVRAVDSAYTSGGTSSSKVIFTGGYMHQRTWVGEPPTSMPLDLHVAFSGSAAAPPLTVHAALATMLVGADGAAASQGVIGGVLDTQEFIDWLRQLAGSISTSLCSGSAFDSIAQQIQQASDIVLGSDGSVMNPQGTPCNAISIGLGFDATAVKLGNAVAVPTSPPVCSP